MRKDTPGIFRATIEWLNKEVFTQQNAEEAEIDEEQCLFEKALNQAILDGKNAKLVLRAEAARYVKNVPSDEEDAPSDEEDAQSDVEEDYDDE